MQNTLSHLELNTVMSLPLPHWICIYCQNEVRNQIVLVCWLVVWVFFHLKYSKSILYNEEKVSYDVKEDRAFFCFGQKCIYELAWRIY